MSNGNGKLRISRPIIDGILIVLLLLSIGVSGYLANQASQESQLAAKNAERAEKGVEQAKDIANETNAKVTKFIEDWWKRVQIGNNNTNTTQRIVLQGIQDVIGNLSDHRHITNLSDANQTVILGKVLNTTNALTSEEYDKAAESKVASIIGNMTEKFDILFRGLNITATDTNTESFDAIQKLKKQIDALEKKTNSTPTK